MNVSNGTLIRYRSLINREHGNTDGHYNEGLGGP